MINTVETGQGVMKHPDVQKGLHQGHHEDEHKSHRVNLVKAISVGLAGTVVAAGVYVGSSKLFGPEGGDYGVAPIAASDTLNPTPTETIYNTEAPTPTPEPTPTPTTTETKSELDGIPAERLQFTKDLLKIYENSLSSNEDEFNKVDDYLTREQIIEYGKTGEYSNIENFSIISHKDGSPAIAMINCQDNVVSGFKKAIKEMEVYDSNYLKLLTDNGMRSFIINRFNEKSGFVYTYNEEGQFVWNLSKEGLKSEIPYMNTLLGGPLYIESVGIKMLNLGGEFAKYPGYFKEGLSAYCWWNLYCKNGQQFCKEMAHAGYIGAKVRYGEKYSQPFRSETIQVSFEKIFKEGLVDFFGGTADEINKNRKSMPDWNPGDLK
ncbi:MAG: hypothetical protein PHE32_03465 [Candidatus Shapirobacteria bacterium]|nr:hypothetical protein [Candidatus Shapirobacteria bacterium]MDD4410732.1 hypothetical protein [Candidatus Shapirobacteria bacterium]